MIDTETGEISIHALVKRATYIYSVPFTMTVISIHALVKRATDIKLGYKKKISISIHALVKRATFECRYVTLVKVDFNPRPREEGDEIEVLHRESKSDFNPRPREEGDSRWAAS